MAPTRPTATQGPIRLRRNRPVNLSFGRIILTGLLHYEPIDGLYHGAQLITSTPGTTEPRVHNLRIGAPLHLDRSWILHTVLDLGHGEATADLVRSRTRTRSTPDHIHPTPGPS